MATVTVEQSGQEHEMTTAWGREGMRCRSRPHENAAMSSTLRSDRCWERLRDNKEALGTATADQLQPEEEATGTGGDCIPASLVLF